MEEKRIAEMGGILRKAGMFKGIPPRLRKMPKMLKSTREETRFERCGLLAEWLCRNFCESCSMNTPRQHTACRDPSAQRFSPD
jgi:hypothetical protein